MCLLHVFELFHGYELCRLRFFLRSGKKSRDDHFFADEEYLLMQLSMPAELMACQIVVSTVADAKNVLGLVQRLDCCAHLRGVHLILHSSTATDVLSSLKRTGSRLVRSTLRSKTSSL